MIKKIKQKLTKKLNQEQRPLPKARVTYNRPYLEKISSLALGEIGEQEACAQLQQVFRGHASRLQGQSDQGLDLAFTCRLPCDEHPLVHFVAQVKTGYEYLRRVGCYEQDCFGIWKGRKTSIKRLFEWRSLEVPVVFLWVNDKTGQVYWRFISKTSKGHSVFVRNTDFLCPLTPFDFILRLNKSRVRSIPWKEPITPLIPPVKGSFKDSALRYYCVNFLGKSIDSPIFGKVFFSWRGWRHLVSNQRSVRETTDSLAFLPAIPIVIEDPDGIVGFRRLERVVRGKVTTESRLIAIERKRIDIKGRGEVDIIVVLRERILYPTEWENDFHFQERIIRDISFESVYQDTTSKRKWLRS
jgi:hypothetical protein